MVLISFAQNLMFSLCMFEVRGETVFSGQNVSSRVYQCITAQEDDWQLN